MFMNLLSDGLTNVFHKSITNYIGQNKFRTSLMFAIKEGTPATDAKQTIIDLKYFVNDEQLYQIKVLNKCCDSAGVYKTARDILKKDKKSPCHARWRMHGASDESIPQRLDCQMSKGGEGNQECLIDRNKSWSKHCLTTCCVFEGESDGGYQFNNDLGANQNNMVRL